jgi:hypothetical protein
MRVIVYAFKPIFNEIVINGRIKFTHATLPRENSRVIGLSAVSQRGALDLFSSRQHA